MTERAQVHDADGMAALGIYESLLFALTDLKIIGEKDARELLTDVITAHSEAAETSLTPNRHQVVVAIVQRILAGKNGLRQSLRVNHRGVAARLTEYNGNMFAPNIAHAAGLEMRQANARATKKADA